MGLGFAESASWGIIAGMRTRRRHPVGRCPGLAAGKPLGRLAEAPARRGLALLVCSLVGLLPCDLTHAACLVDPLMQGQDPEVALKDHVYNLVQSDGCNIHLRRSVTLAGLAAAANPIVFAAGCSNVWAPEIHWLGTNWFIYYSVDTDAPGNERVHVAQGSGTNPNGPYTERGVLLPGFWNIDGSVFTAPNGQLYFVCSGRPAGTQCIYIAPMSNPLALSGPPVLLSSPTQSWELNGSVNEGPFGFVRNGQVFIVYSASGCWTDDYCLGLLTLTGSNPLDPAAWTKSGPVFSKTTGAYGPGHNCVFQDDGGQWWNIYHANNFSGQGCGAYRQLRVQRLTWNSDNTPYFGTPVPLGSLVTEDTNYLVCDFALTETNGSMAATTTCGPPGTFAGAPLWLNPGLELNGVNQYVVCSHTLGNDVQSFLTLCAWVKADAFIDWAGILTKGTNASPFALQTWHDGSLRFTANWGAPPGSIGGGSWNSATKMTTNQWYYVAVTYDGTTVRFYLNGVLDPYQPAVDLHFGVVDQPLTLGADLPGGQEYFSGALRDVRLYGRALSQAEINALAEVSPPPVLAPIPDQSLVAGQTLVVSNQVSDPDVPPQTLTFSLLAAPQGAQLNPTNGVFQWRPRIAQSPSTNTVSLMVADNSSPGLSATQSFQVTVRRPVAPTLILDWLAGSSFQLRVTGDLGPDYSLYTSTNLDPPDWSLLLTTNPPAMPLLFSDPAAVNLSRRFYRVLLGP
jgi:GH43 family beta-xylosidase